MENIKTDICVIGAGAGGLSVAAGAVQMGAKTVLLEGEKMGGDCLNYGCVPSKALIAAAKAAHGGRHGARMGMCFSAPDIDFAGVKDYVQEIIARIAPHDSEERFTKMGVRVIRENGHFVSRRAVETGNYRIYARRFVIATGSKPIVPPVIGLDKIPYETNKTFFDLREKPEHLIVLGAGPIGIEMAQASVRLGVKTTLLEGFKILPRDDAEAREILLDKLKKEGLEIFEGALVASVSGRAGAISVKTKDERVFEGSHLLVGGGRCANIQALNLARGGIKADHLIKVRDDLRTTNKRVYAIGDVIGELQFSHVAGYHASIVLRSILFGLPARRHIAHLPYATYTDPELAQIGLKEEDAKKKYGKALEVIRADFSENDRAIAEDKAFGFIKVMVVKKRPIGVTIIGSQAGEMMAFWSLAITQRLKMSQLATMVAPYPTFSELNKKVIGAYFAPRLFESNMVKKIVRFIQNWS